ncbi:sulfatase [Blastopirellula sp. J2-11]|uniref:sulfatase n=1 Tax=Blastopirellula sp. J2-11 TaxID=2943192 RepID=UPI0021C6BA69|nr:sulfatase [Blastopirellula sp. J2-11]UUO06431.1 sulfatase [Blastopirellula sp. J2-11]
MTFRSALGEERPNVLFISVDDLRPELNCYGQEQIHSPNIDKLASQSALFERAYCMVSVCGASRASMLTGIRPTPQRFTSWTARADEEAPGIVTMNAWFKNHGYHTVSLGKIFNDADDSAAGWSTQPWRLNDEKWPWYAEPENQLLHRKRGAQEPRNRGPAWEAADVADDAYLDGQTAIKATAELRRLAQRQEPFFLAVGFFKPHLPFNAPKKYWDLYPREAIALSENASAPRGAPRISLHNWGEMRRYSNIPRKGAVDDETARSLIHGYFACVSYIDALVGQVLHELERLDLSDKTIVVLWSDHGWNLGEHTLWCKHSCYETSMRIPLLVRLSKQRAALRIVQPVESIALYPTLCELAGLPLPEHLQGSSLVPLLNGSTEDANAIAVGRYGQGDTIRSAQYRYTQYSRVDGKQLGEMLYDHETDPDENQNVSGKPSYGEALQHLQKRLRETTRK